MLPFRPIRPALFPKIFTLPLVIILITVDHTEFSSNSSKSRSVSRSQETSKAYCSMWMDVNGSSTRSSQKLLKPNEPNLRWFGMRFQMIPRSIKTNVCQDPHVATGCRMSFTCPMNCLIWTSDKVICISYVPISQPRERAWISQLIMLIEKMQYFTSLYQVKLENAAFTNHDSGVKTLWIAVGASLWIFNHLSSCGWSLQLRMGSVQYVNPIICQNWGWLWHLDNSCCLCFASILCFPHQSPNLLNQHRFFSRLANHDVLPKGKPVISPQTARTKKWLMRVKQRP